MITIESINKKLGFDILEYLQEESIVKDTEYDPVREPIFHVLTDEEVSFIVDYRLNLLEKENEDNWYIIFLYFLCT